METSRRSVTVLGAIVAGALAAASTVRAADASYGAYAGVGYSDNIARTPNGELEDTIASVGGQLGIDHESRRLKADIATRLEFRDYLDDTFDTEIVGNLIGNALFTIIDDHLTWTLEDTFGQALQDQFAPATPDNSENVNHFSTGPDFMLALGSRNRLVVHGRYIDVNYEDSLLGNQRTRGEVSLLRDLSEASSISINVNSEDVSFDDDDLFTDYERREAYLGYEVNAARTTLSIQGGITEIGAEGETDDSWLGRVSLVRRVSPALELGLELGHDFADAGSWFSQMQQLQPGSVDPVPVQQTSSPFENNYAFVFTNFSRNRTGLYFRAARYDEKYEVQPLFDRTRTTVDASLERHLNASLSVYVAANFSRQEYESLAQEFTDTSGTLGLRWNIGRVTSLQSEYQYRRRNGDTTDDYRSNELWLRLAYTVGADVAKRSFDGM